MQSVGKASLLSRCTSSAGYLARPVGRLDGQRWVVSRVQQRPDIGIDSASTAELWELHEELLREIEERKKYQSQLLEKLDRIRSAPVARTAAPPAPPAPPAPTVPKVAPPRIPSPTPRVPAYRPVPSPPPAPLPAPPLPPQIQYVAEPVAPAEPAKPPPLAGENVMNIVMVGAECAPWSKTGGLGDVMGALPKAFARRGHRVMAIAPRYAVYQEAWETGVRKTLRVCNSDQEVGFFHSYVDGVDYVFVDHPSFHNRSGGEIYGGDRESLQFRCALLSKAALEAVWHVPCGGITYGDENLVFIANDWHTALVPIYLQAHYRDYNQMTYARCVFIIHNLAHQGRGPFVEADKLELNEHYKEQLRLYDPVGGEHMNWMKGAFINAHRIIAVSNGYAWECKTQEGGWGLDSILREQDWKLQGIVNGIDYNEWSPMKDVFLKEDGYCNYSTETLDEGKAKCKAALQRELGLPVDPNVPLLGFIGRLDYQKGVDLITESYDWLMAQGVQLVMLGSGRQDLEEQLRNMESRNKNQCRAWVGFSVKMAHRITAGCDILLMPSRFEPCGLNQLYSMAYGMVPVVHSVGGLRDTVQQFDPFAENGQGKGTGWTFDRAESTKLRDAIYNAISTYRNHRDAFKRIQIRGMSQDMSWDNAAQVYEQVLVAAKYQW